jgi:hypothetical protein
MRSILLLLLCLALPLSAEKLRILMIGNSYTSQTLGEIRGFLKSDQALDVELVAHCPGGRKLHQHLESPKVEALLSGRVKWDVVILQEQSQLPALAMKKGGKSLEQFESGGVGLIRKILKEQPGARILLFETWARHPEPDRAGTLKWFDGKPGKMQEALTKGYRHLLVNPGKWDFTKSVAIVPVGTAWLAWYQAVGYVNPFLTLHKEDCSHPGKQGAYLTGAMFYEAITGKPATGSSYDGGIRGNLKGKPLAKALREQAHRTSSAAKK